MEQTLEGHRDDLSAMAFSSDGQLLVSGDRDGTLKFWHLPSNREVMTVQASGCILKLSFSADGQWLGALVNSRQIMIFDGRVAARLGPARK